jgi:hypothetical protein
LKLPSEKIVDSRTTLGLGEIVGDFARGLERVDSTKPVARSLRSGAEYHPGIGAHSEQETLRLVLAHLGSKFQDKYGTLQIDTSYLDSREKCDLVIGEPEAPFWALEVKMIRLMGNNGKPNDNLVMHVLSPYAEHRSAVTDAEKLARSKFNCPKAILMFGYEYENWPLEPLVRAFEVLTRVRVHLQSRHEVSFSDLVHPIHRRGRVFGWEVVRNG